VGDAGSRRLPRRSTFAAVPDRLPTGKLRPELLRDLLRSQAPLPAEVRLGPELGEDACAIDLPEGTLVAATDPITLTGSGVGSHSVVINANDVAVMGVRPRWFLATVLLPDGASEQQVREIFAGIRSALEAVGASLVGGHTEVTAAVAQPVVVGQMLGLAENGRFVRTGGALEGDLIVQAGAAPVEGAAVLAAEASERLSGVDAEVLERAREALVRPGISVVESALLATEFGAHALHDPTEGGLATGLHELAEASKLKIRLSPVPPIWFEPGRVVCEALGADPWGTLASGTLLAALPFEPADALCRELTLRGVPAHAIGKAVPGRGVETAGGRPLPRFDRDEVARVLAE
jgi:hydrogenase expression/formation protein HypE